MMIESSGIQDVVVGSPDNPPEVIHNRGKSIKSMLYRKIESSGNRHYVKFEHGAYEMSRRASRAWSWGAGGPEGLGAWIPESALGGVARQGGGWA